MFAALPKSQRAEAVRLCVLLRLAVLLHRARQDLDLAGLRLRAGRRGLQLKFARGWLRRHPLTAVYLELERDWLTAAGMRLQFG